MTNPLGIPEEQWVDVVTTANSEFGDLDYIFQFLKDQADTSTLEDAMEAIVRNHYWNDFLQFIAEGHGYVSPRK